MMVFFMFDCFRLVKVVQVVLFLEVMCLCSVVMDLLEWCVSLVVLVKVVLVSCRLFFGDRFNCVVVCFIVLRKQNMQVGLLLEMVVMVLSFFLLFSYRVLFMVLRMELVCVCCKVEICVCGIMFEMFLLIRVGVLGMVCMMVWWLFSQCDRFIMWMLVVIEMISWVLMKGFRLVIILCICCGLIVSIIMFVLVRVLLMDCVVVILNLFLSVCSVLVLRLIMWMFFVVVILLVSLLINVVVMLLLLMNVIFIFVFCVLC